MCGYFWREKQDKLLNFSQEYKVVKISHKNSSKWSFLLTTTTKDIGENKSKFTTNKKYLKN